ncbi:hypothetical protein HAP94_10795 [Acidithiobacillus ferrivorans]|nr:hypothetical protein [Acidithiobacillus ferrivorans]
MIINARKFLRVLSAVTKCPAHAIYIEAAKDCLRVSTLDTRGATGVKVPWVEPPLGSHSDAWQVPVESLVRLVKAFVRPDRDENFELTGTSDRIRIEYSGGHVNLKTMSHRRHTDAEGVIGGNVPSVVLPLRSMRFVLGSANEFTNQNSECETFSTTCIELVVRTPAGSYRQGVSASVPIQGVSLRATGSDGKRLGLFECPVNWESLADMVAFRAIARDDLRWGLAAVSSFAGGVGKLVRVQFLDSEHGLHVSDPDGTWFVSVPWSPLTYFNYLSVAGSIPEAVMVKSLGSELSAGSELLSTLQRNEVIVFQDQRDHIAMFTSHSDASVLQSAIESTRIALENHHAPKPDWLAFGIGMLQSGDAQRPALPDGWSTQSSVPAQASLAIAPKKWLQLPVVSATAHSATAVARPMVRNHGLYMAPVTQRLQGYSFEPVAVCQEALKKTARHFRAADAFVDISIPSAKVAGMRMQLRHTNDNGCKSLAVIAVNT